MAFYDYQCEKCKKIKKNVMKSILHVDELPEFCCEAKMKRLIGASQFIQQSGYSYNTSERKTPKSFS